MPFVLDTEIQVDFEVGLEPQAKRILKEGHSYSTNYTGGEIFRQIRRCQFNRDKIGEDRWRACLTENQESELDRLLERPLLLEALDSLLPYRGLWGAFYLGSMDMFLSLRCDEVSHFTCSGRQLNFYKEITNYIALIRSTLDEILGSDPSLIPCVDEQTLNLIQLRSPGVSTADAEFLRRNAKDLFPDLADAATRSRLLARLLGIKTLIPSISTLFKDLRCLQPAGKALRALVPQRGKGTLRESFRRIFPKNIESLDLQQSETSFSIIHGNPDYLFDIAFRQLFLCAARYFIDPSNVSTKKNMNPIEQVVNPTKRFLGFRLVALSRKLQFQVPNFDGELEAPSERLLKDVLNCLPRQLFNFDGHLPLALLTSFEEFLSKGTVVAGNTSPTATSTPGVSLLQRCGQSCFTRGGEDASPDNDFLHLFIGNLHEPLNNIQGAGFDVSSFFVKRSIYLAFFGNINANGEQSTSRMDTDDIRGRDEPSFTVTHTVRPADGPPGNGGQREERTTTAQRGQHGSHTHVQVNFVNKDGHTLSSVPFSRRSVEEEAKKYGGQNFSLMDERGRYWLWDDCYNALVDTESHILIVVSPQAA